MRAKTALRAPACKICAHKTATGISDAHGTVTKGLKLHIGNGIFNFADFFKRSFPSEHDAFKAEPFIKQSGGSVDAARLRAQVKRRVGELFLQNRHDAQILHDKRIDRIALKIIDIVLKGSDVLVMKGDIERAVEFFPGKAFFELAYSLVFVVVKIVGFDAERKMLETDVRGVRSVRVCVI